MENAISGVLWHLCKRQNHKLYYTIARPYSLILLREVSVWHQKMVKLERWTWLYVACFLDFLGASMIMPVFGSHLRSLGISHTLVGLLSSCYGTIQLITGPIIGSWSDINGRHSILLLSIMLSSVAYGVMGTVSSFYIFFIIRCFLGAFKHTQTLCRACVADIVPVERQASVQGLINAFTSFSFMIGPVIGGHIMEMNNGFQYLTTLVFVIFILNGSVVYVLADGRNISNKTNERNDHQTFLSGVMMVFKELYAIDWVSFWPLFSVKLLIGLAGTMFFQNIGVILTENFELSPKYLGYTISFYGFLSGVCNLSVGKIKSLKILPEKHVKSLLYTISLLTVTLLFLYAVLVSQNYTLFLSGFIPLATSQALTRIFLTEVLLEQSTANSRGSVMGAASSVSSVARIIAPFLSGLLSSWKGTSSALLLSSATAATACVLTTSLMSSHHTKKH